MPTLKELKIKGLDKCPHCGEVLNKVKVPLINGTYYYFIYCRNSTCRFCRCEDEKGEEIKYV